MQVVAHSAAAAEKLGGWGWGLRALLKGSPTVVDERYSFTFPAARFLPVPVWGFEPRTRACLSFRLYRRKVMCFNYTWIFDVTVIEFKLENLAFPLGRLARSKAYVTLHNWRQTKKWDSDTEETLNELERGGSLEAGAQESRGSLCWGGGCKWDSR